MEQVTITRVYKDKVTTKYGVKDKTSIYTEEYPEVKMSSFDKGAVSFDVGQKVDITIEKNGQFTNFKIGDGVKTGYGKSTNTIPSSDNHEGRIKKLEQAVFGQAEPTVEVTPVKSDDFDDFAADEE